MGKNYTKGFIKDDINAPIPPRVQALKASKRVYIDGVNGNDDNDGTQTYPIKTLDTFFDMCHHDEMDIRAYIVSPGTYTATYQSYTSIAIHITANVPGVTLNFQCSRLENIAFYQCHLNLQTADPENFKMAVKVTGSVTTHPSTHIYLDSGTFWVRGVDFQNPFYIYGAGGLAEYCVFREGIRNNWGNIKAQHNEYHYNNCHIFHGENGYFLICGEKTKFVIDSTSGENQIAHLLGGAFYFALTINDNRITGNKLTKTSQEWFFDNVLIITTQSRLNALAMLSEKFNQSFIDAGGYGRLNHCLLGPATQFPE